MRAPRLVQVALDGTGDVYQYTVHPTIQSLSYSTTGLRGGSPLTISGSNFATTPSDNTVLLSGVPCTVTSATATQLVCLPGATNASTPAFVPQNGSSIAPFWNSTYGPAAYKGRMWPAGRGLLHSVFYNAGPSGSWWNRMYDRSVNTFPAASVRPDLQWLDTDTVSGFSWNEVRVPLLAVCRSHRP